MERLWKVKDAFGYFGAVPANIQWSWSARSPDGKTVVVNWWKDLIIRRDGKLIYDTFILSNLPEWRDRIGNRERIRDLSHARDHCDGLFRVVWTQAADQDQRIRKTVERYPGKDLWMKLLKLDVETGQFLAVEVLRA